MLVQVTNQCNVVSRSLAWSPVFECACPGPKSVTRGLPWSPVVARRRMCACPGPKSAARGPPRYPVVARGLPYAGGCLFGPQIRGLWSPVGGLPWSPVVSRGLSWSPVVSQTHTSWCSGPNSVAIGLPRSPVVAHRRVGDCRGPKSVARGLP